MRSSGTCNTHCIFFPQCSERKVTKAAYVISISKKQYFHLTSFHKGALMKKGHFVLTGDMKWITGEVANKISTEVMKTKEFRTL